MEEAKSRLQSMEKSVTLPFEAKFLVGNAFSKSIVDSLVGDEKYDVISCQFAFHYAFETAESANDAFKSISSHLKPGGKFICTVPNASRLM